MERGRGPRHGLSRGRHVHAVPPRGFRHEECGRQLFKRRDAIDFDAIESAVRGGGAWRHDHFGPGASGHCEPELRLAAHDVLGAAPQHPHWSRPRPWLQPDVHADRPGHEGHTGEPAEPDPDIAEPLAIPPGRSEQQHMAFRARLRIRRREGARLRGGRRAVRAEPGLDPRVNSDSAVLVREPLQPVPAGKADEILR